MATIVFTCNRKYSSNIEYPRLLIYHGNVKINAWKHYRYNDIFGRPCVDYLTKDTNFPDINVPTYEKMKNGLVPDDLRIDTWEYEITDIDSEEKYCPLFINLCEGANIVKYPEGKTLNDWIQKMLNVPSTEELLKFVTDTNICTFVVSTDVPIFITQLDNNVLQNQFMTIYCLTTSMPKIELSKCNWIDRYSNLWKRKCKGDPTKYKKSFIIEKLIGDDGMCLVGNFGDIADTYYLYDDVSKILNSFTTLDYSKPFNTPEAVKIQRQKDLERADERKRQIEANKLKDGYCDKCGRERAQYVRDPYNYTGWLCPECYRIEYGIE